MKYEWMTRGWVSVAIVVLGLSAVGCGADCAALCEERKQCDGADEEDRDADCEKSCEEDEKHAEAAGCESQYEEALSCLDDHEDVCKAKDACASKDKALAECVEK